MRVRISSHLRIAVRKGYATCRKTGAVSVIDGQAPTGPEKNSVLFSGSKNLVVLTFF
jgi:hypothetical protein